MSVYNSINVLDSDVSTLFPLQLLKVIFVFIKQSRASVSNAYIRDYSQ